MGGAGGGDNIGGGARNRDNTGGGACRLRVEFGALFEAIVVALRSSCGFVTEGVVLALLLPECHREAHNGD